MFFYPALVMNGSSGFAGSEADDRAYERQRRLADEAREAPTAKATASGRLRQWFARGFSLRSAGNGAGALQTPATPPEGAETSDAQAILRLAMPGLRPVEAGVGIDVGRPPAFTMPARASGLYTSGTVHLAPEGRPKIATPVPTPEAWPEPWDEIGPVRLEDYRVPTFRDHRGWSWMVPMCVSRYVLLENIAAHTETAGQDAGTFEAHAMGMLYNGVIHLWRRGEDGVTRSHAVGPEAPAAHEEAHPDQHLLWADGCWSLYAPETESITPVAGPATETLYAALLQGYVGRAPTSEQIAACRRSLAASMRSEINRESYAARALREVRQRYEVFVDANPRAAAALEAQLSAFVPKTPPTFLWDGEEWPHPACAGAREQMSRLVRTMRRMGAWGSELEAEAVAGALGWRVHMWKRAVPEAGKSTSEFVRVVAYGPQAGHPVHVVNIIDNRHYARFSPKSDAWQRSTGEVRSRGEVYDCGAGGNCLYHSLLGPGSTEGLVARLRRKMVMYIQAHREQYETVASEAVDIRWNDFLATRPEEAAWVGKQAEAFCARQIAANRAEPMGAEPGTAVA